MAAVSLFWDTNMAAVTSCKNTLLGKHTKQKRSIKLFALSVDTFKSFYQLVLNNQKGLPVMAPTFRSPNEYIRASRTAHTVKQTIFFTVF